MSTPYVELEWEEEERTEFYIQLTTGEETNPQFKVFIRYDGCAEITWEDNEMESGGHVCNLSEFVRLMNEASNKAREHFEGNGTWE